MNATIHIAQGQQGQPHPGMPGPNPRPQGLGVNGAQSGNGDGSPMAIEELDAARSREIQSKAVSAIILLLLKWFKISREFFSISKLSFLCSSANQ